MTCYLLIPLLFLTALDSIAGAEPLTIDLTKDIPAAVACPYGPGSTTSPSGHTFTADQRSFFIDGKAWIPIVGAFHYVRYPCEGWRDELLKMRAGGIIPSPRTSSGFTMRKSVAPTTGAGIIPCATSSSFAKS